MECVYEQFQNTMVYKTVCRHQTRRYATRLKWKTRSPRLRSTLHVFDIGPLNILPLFHCNPFISMVGTSMVGTLLNLQYVQAR
jgi:hypothetical protein